MSLITRLSRLFQADIHAFLDKIEEPEQLLRQTIWDMEEAIAADEKQIRCWEYEQQQLSNKHKQLAESLVDLEEKLALCFQSNKDNLAWSLIKQKLELQQATKRLSENLSVLTEKTSCLTKQLTEHKVQLANMKQKVEVLLDENLTVTTQWQSPQAVLRDEDVEIAFLYEKQKWSNS